MTDIAETAQRALLRQAPSLIGSLGFATRYRSATKEALVGGDLYDVADPKRASASSSAMCAARAWRPSSWRRPYSPGSGGQRSPRRPCAGPPRPGRCGGFRGRGGGLRHRRARGVPRRPHGHDGELRTPATHAGVRGQFSKLLDTGQPEPPLGLGASPGSGHVRVPRARTVAVLHRRPRRDPRSQRGLPRSGSSHDEALRTGDREDALDAVVHLLVDHAADGIDDDVALLMVERSDRAYIAEPWLQRIRGEPVAGGDRTVSTSRSRCWVTVSYRGSGLRQRHPADHRAWAHQNPATMCVRAATDVVSVGHRRDRCARCRLIRDRPSGSRISEVPGTARLRAQDFPVRVSTMVMGPDRVCRTCKRSRSA